MQHTLMRLLVALCLVVACHATATAQYHRERALVREGNRHFERRNFNTALNRYNEALEHDSTAYEALYNRANVSAQALLHNRADTQGMAQRWKISNLYYDTLAADSLLSDKQRAEVLRNLGESLFMQQNYEAALNSFRESLLLNADDAECKHNYVLTKRIVDQKRQQQQQNQQNDNQQQNNQSENDQNKSENQDNEGNDDQPNDQNSEDNKDGQNNENKDNRDNKDNQDKQNDKNDQNKDNQDDKEQNGDQPNDDGKNDEDKQENDQQGESQPQPRGISRDEQERMLDAIQSEEDKTQDKLKEGKGVYVPGKKNW